MMTLLGKRAILGPVLKALWLFACVLILALTLIYRGPENRDSVEAEALIMMGLSFPSGWLFLVMLKLIEMLKLFEWSGITELQSIFLVWVPLFVLGYLQWFVLVPAIVRWWRRKFGNGGSGNISVVPKD
jgi:hypothetical protein